MECILEPFSHLTSFNLLQNHRQTRKLQFEIILFLHFITESDLIFFHMFDDGLLGRKNRCLLSDGLSEKRVDWSRLLCIWIRLRRRFWVIVIVRVLKTKDCVLILLLTRSIALENRKIIMVRIRRAQKGVTLKVL